MGIVFHQGDFYHEPDEKHIFKKEDDHYKEECRGELMTVVYKKNNIWLKFLHESVYEITLEEVQDLIYIKKKEKRIDIPRDKQWTPAMLLYR